MDHSRSEVNLGQWLTENASHRAFPCGLRDEVWQPHWIAQQPAATIGRGVMLGKLPIIKLAPSK